MIFDVLGNTRNNCIVDQFHLSFDDRILLYDDLRFFGRNSLLLNFGLLGEGKGNESETQNLQKFKKELKFNNIWVGFFIVLLLTRFLRYVLNYVDLFSNSKNVLVIRNNFV